MLDKSLTSKMSACLSGGTVVAKANIIPNKTGILTVNRLQFMEMVFSFINSQITNSHLGGDLPCISLSFGLVLCFIFGIL